MDTKEFVFAYLKNQSLAVIATTDGAGKPEAALVSFGQTETFELIFNTSNATLKYQNLQKNAQVAAVIGWQDGQTVQYEGNARELNDEELPPYKALLYAKNPASRTYEDRPDERHFVVTPHWIRYSDIRQEPPIIIELIF